MNTGEEYREIKTGEGVTNLEVLPATLNTRFGLFFKRAVLNQKTDCQTFVKFAVGVIY